MDQAGDGDSDGEFSVRSFHRVAWADYELLKAQDLGLHRAEAVKQNIEMRRRVWGACVISDRWWVHVASSGDFH